MSSLLALVIGALGIFAHLPPELVSRLIARDPTWPYVRRLRVIMNF